MRKLFLAVLSVGAMFGVVSPGKADETVRCINSTDTPGTSKAVVVGSVPLAHTGTILPVEPDGRIASDKIEAQVERVFTNLNYALKKVDSSLEKCVKLHVYAVNDESADAVRRALGKRFTGKVKPAVAFVVGKLAHPEARVAMDAVALAGPQTEVVRRGEVAVVPVGSRVYVAGQAEKGTDIAEATRKTLASLRATLQSLRLTDKHVVQVKAFMEPMTAVAEVEREVKQFFGENTPPIVFVEWNMSTPIEIELIAWAGRTRETPEGAVGYFTPPGMKASPIYSRVALLNHGKSIYISGLYGKSTNNGEAETKELFAELKEILAECGSDLKHLVKATYYVSTDDASKKLNELRPGYYDPARPPAASKAMVAGTGQKGKTITIDMIAVQAPDGVIK